MTTTNPTGQRTRIKQRRQAAAMGLFYSIVMYGVSLALTEGQQRGIRSSMFFDNGNWPDIILHGNAPLRIVAGWLFSYLLCRLVFAGLGSRRSSTTDDGPTTKADYSRMFSGFSLAFASLMAIMMLAAGSLYYSFEVFVVTFVFFIAITHTIFGIVLLIGLLVRRMHPRMSDAVLTFRRPISRLHDMDINLNLHVVRDGFRRFRGSRLVTRTVGFFEARDVPEDKPDPHTQS